MHGVEGRGNTRNPSRYMKQVSGLPRGTPEPPSRDPRTTGSTRLANYGSPAKLDPLVNKVLSEHIFFFFLPRSF